MQANIGNTNATNSRHQGMNAGKSSGQSMDQVGNLSFSVTWKKSQVFSVDPEAPIWEAAQMMRDHQIGDVLVMERSGRPARPVGMITDRDIALCLSERVDLLDLKVMDVMTPTVITASVNDDLFKLIHIMKDSGVTRLPLADEDGAIIGVLTAKNILEILVNCFFDVTQISEQQQQNELSNH